MASSTVVLHDRPRPDLDELEVSIFGRGVGESIVVHLGGGDWIVVDSFVFPGTNEPIAIQYLRSIDVNPAQAIRLVVATHWHTDHTRGLDLVLEAAPIAGLLLSAALRTQEFMTLCGASRMGGGPITDIDELRSAIEVVKRRAGPMGDQIKWAFHDVIQFRNRYSEVYSLSPSNASLTRSLDELADLIPKTGTPMVRRAAHSANELSVVLWLTFGTYRVLLGGDLEQTAAPNSGWRAAAATLVPNGSTATPIKIPHHGSITAHSPEMWNTLVSADKSYAIVAPYTALAQPIPRASDLNRMKDLATQVYLVAPTTNRKVVGYPRDVARMIKITTSDIREVRPGYGHFRLRLRSGESEGSVQLFGTATLHS